MTESVYDQAVNLGIEYALDQISAGASYRDSPLSGEWAGDLTQRDVYYNVTGSSIDISDEQEVELMHDLATEWEDAYHGTWQRHLDERAVPGA